MDQTQRLVFPKADLSPPDSASDPEEKEITDDEDDDRNHKHRRRDTQALPLERNVEQVLTRPYRNRNKPFENGHPHREAASRSTETWRNYNMTPLEKDFPEKFDRRRPGLTPVSRAPLDLNQRIWGNQSWTGDPGSGRGRGRELGPWSVRDSRFNPDLNPAIVQQGYVPSSLFAGRGTPNVSNAHSASWSAYGLVTGLPNGGLDSFHSLGLQRTLRAPINPLMKMGIPHQRCTDFEERGFCLRGDMCPMEHGINRIVIEDVQSLSQFNLPVALPNAHLMGASDAGALSAASAPSTLGTGQGVYTRSTKAGAEDDELGFNGATVDSAVASGADFYDPDQPLWTKDSSRTSTGLLDRDPIKAIQGDNQLSLRQEQHIGLNNGSNNENSVKNPGTALGSHSRNLSVRGQIHNSKHRKNSGYTGNVTNEYPELLDTVEDAVGHQGKMTNTDDIVSHGPDSSVKNVNNTARFIQKTSQKAQCTLFVSGIPHKDNKRDTLLSHFQKFGDVINIFIPLNSERAFVQFSKREEADDALKAPDAVLGNRFIKLWWANRDNVPVDGISTANAIPVASRVVEAASVPDIPAVSTKEKDDPKGGKFHASVSPVLTSDYPKPVTNGPPPAMQKKVESLDYFKELRKKQEMLDKKRNDLKRALERLEKQKQATSISAEPALEQAAKKHKIETVADAPNRGTPSSIDSCSILSSTRAETTDRSRSGGDTKPHSSSTGTMVSFTESSSNKRSTRQQATAGEHFGINRFKLDNRPTSFKISPPLPTGLANVSALKEHFSTFGDISNVDLADIELENSDVKSVTISKCACVYFNTRHSAERAFSNGNCWKGHSLQFIWLTSSKENADRGNPSLSSTKGSSDANDHPVEVATLVSEKITMSGNKESENSERNLVCKI